MWLVLQTLWFVPLALAGASWVPWLLRRRPIAVEWLAIGWNAGYALLIVLGWLSASTEMRGTSLMVFVVGAGSLGIVMSRRVMTTGARSAEPFPVLAIVALAWVLVLALVPRVVVQNRVGHFPAGWDPFFHLTVVRAAELGHGIPWTLAPFEQVHLNYPWGSHLAILGHAGLCGAPAHEIFATHNSVISVVGAMGAMAYFAWRWLRDVRASVATAAVYGCLVHAGSLMYAGWGGLPNNVGMALFVLCWALHTDDADTRERNLAGVCMGLALLVHHHVMVAGAGAMLFHALVTGWASRSTDPLRAFLRLIGLAAIVGSPVLGALVLHVGDTASTSMFRSHESYHYEWSDLWKDSPGTAAIVLASAGFVLLRPGERGRGQAPITFLTAMLLAFALTGELWRVGSWLLVRQTFTAFTPSRFLNDAGYPAAVLGGVAISSAMATVRRPVLVVIALLPFLAAEPWLALRMQHLGDEAMWLDVAKLAPRIPEDAAVAPGFHEHYFCGYLLARECMDTPRPVSEPRDERDGRKREFRQNLLAGRIDPVRRAELFGKRPIYVVTTGSLPGTAAFVAREGQVTLGVVP